MTIIWEKIFNEAPIGMCLLQAKESLQIELANPNILRFLSCKCNKELETLLNNSNIFSVIRKSVDASSSVIEAPFISSKSNVPNCRFRIQFLDKIQCSLFIIPNTQTYTETELELYWRSVINSPSDFFVIVNREGIYQYVNRTIGGNSMEDLIGKKSIYDFIPTDDCDNIRNKIQKVFDTGIPDTWEQHVPRYNIHTLNTVNSIIKDDQIVAISMITKDITQQKNAELALVKSSKLAAIGELAAKVGHEINNPLAVIKGILELHIKNLKKYKIFNKVFKNKLEHILKAVERIANIVKGLKGFIKAEIKNQNTSEIHETIQDVLKFIGGLNDLSQIRINKKFDAKKIHVKINSSSIHQIITNLVMNSKDALKDHPNPQIDISTKNEGSDVLIEFSDNGPGIQNTIKNELFGPFVSTKGNEGTGLGLSITQSLVVSIGGSIECIPSQDGAKFLITLPTTTLSENEAKILSENDLNINLKSILIVDDEEGILLFLKNYFQELGPRVAISKNRKEALEIAKKESFDAVLVDWTLPDVEGPDLIEELIPLGQADTSYVIITGNIERPSKIMIQNHTVNVLMKPFSSDELIRSLTPIELKKSA